MRVSIDPLHNLTPVGRDEGVRTTQGGGITGPDLAPLPPARWGEVREGGGGHSTHPGKYSGAQIALSPCRGDKTKAPVLAFRCVPVEPAGTRYGAPPAGAGPNQNQEGVCSK